MPAVWLSCALAVLGHNPDTSYARVEIAASEVKTRLTYDIFTLLSIVQLDDDANHEVSRAELTRHLPEIQEFLRQQISLWIDGDFQRDNLGQPAGFVWPPDTGDAIREADYHAATGLIIFEFRQPVARMPSEVGLQFSFFDRFTDRHTVLGVFAIPGDEYETTFTKYEPDFHYVTGAPPAEPATDAQPAPPAKPPTRHSLAERLWRFFHLGVEHIFLGYDHICFLIALIVVSKFRQVVKIVTSFTIAHSITLILATLDVVQLDPRLVEIAIAATIVYVAIENIFVATESLGIKDASHRWWLTFFFGLVHGFGFANVLRELGLPTTGLVRCLLAFNVGVEVGQLLIALALLPLAWGLAWWEHGRKVVIGISLLLASFGLAWFVDRAFALDFMPF
jgi:hypothetical protein